MVCLYVVKPMVLGIEKKVFYYSKTLVCYKKKTNYVNNINITFVSDYRKVLIQSQIWILNNEVV